MSVGLHALILAGLLWVAGHGSGELPLAGEPMVYIEPAPPPLPGVGGAPIESPSAPSEPAPESPPEVAVPQRLVAPTPPRPAKAPAVVKKATPKPAAPVPVAKDAGQGGSVGGEAHGVVGGVPGGTGTEPVPLALAGRPPVVVSKVTPAYPALARERGIEGVVVLRGVVDIDGRPTRLQVVQSVPLLDDAALAAFGRWRFTPGRDREGKVVAVLIEVPIRFRLQ